MRLLAPVLIVIFAAPFAALADEPDLTPVKRWIAHQSTVTSVRAKFVQERQLRSLKRPLVEPGTFVFSEPGAFRWELGEPAQTIAVKRDGEDLVVLRTQKKEAHRFRAEQLAEEGPGGAVGFLSAGFPRTFEAFDANFKVTEVALEGGKHIFTTSLRDRRASVALRKVVFTVDAETLRPESVYLRFRDSSSITTRFTEIREGVEVDEALFELDLTGYEVKTK